MSLGHIKCGKHRLWCPECRLIWASASPIMGGKPPVPKHKYWTQISPFPIAKWSQVMLRWTRRTFALFCSHNRQNISYDLLDGKLILERWRMGPHHSAWVHTIVFSRRKRDGLLGTFVVWKKTAEGRAWVVKQDTPIDFWWSASSGFHLGIMQWNHLGWRVGCLCNLVVMEMTSRSCSTGGAS